jgi:4-hydroxy 2-oxovalerate aldolase
VALREALDENIAIGIHEHNNLSLAVANSLVAVQAGATIADVALAGMGAGAGNCQTEALVAVLHRLGYDTGVDLFALQDAADDYVRSELMPGPIVVDRLTATMGYANVPASFLLHVIRAGERFGVDPRRIILALGERQAVTGQEDMILEVAGALASEGCPRWRCSSSTTIRRACRVRRTYRCCWHGRRDSSTRRCGHAPARSMS